MDVSFAVFADAANVSTDGKLNILGVFDQIQVPSFPAAHPMMRVVLRLEAGPAEYDLHKDVEVILLNEDGGRLAAVKLGFTVGRRDDGESVTMNAVMELRNVAFEGPGRHALHVLINGEEKRRVPLRLMQVEAAPTPLAPDAGERA